MNKCYVNNFYYACCENWEQDIVHEEWIQHVSHYKGEMMEVTPPHFKQHCKGECLTNGSDVVLCSEFSLEFSPRGFLELLKSFTQFRFCTS